MSLSNWRINTAFNDDAQLYIVKGYRGEVLDCAVAWLDLAVGSVRNVCLRVASVGWAMGHDSV